MISKFNPAHPYIPRTNSVTGKEIRVQLCCYVFNASLTDEQVALIELDSEVFLQKNERGYFVAHYLDDANWYRRHGIDIDWVMPPLEDGYPAVIDPSLTLVH